MRVRWVEVQETGSLGEPFDRNTSIYGFKVGSTAAASSAVFRVKDANGYVLSRLSAASGSDATEIFPDECYVEAESGSGATLEQGIHVTITGASAVAAILVQANDNPATP